MHPLAHTAAPTYLTPVGLWLWLRFPRFEIAFFRHMKFSPEWTYAVNNLPGPHFASMYPPARRHGTDVQFRIWQGGRPHASYASKRFETMFWVPFNLKIWGRWKA
jgi:hypothetical protein